MSKAPEHIYSTLFDAMPEAVFVHPIRESGFGKFLMANRTAQKLYGYAQEEFPQLTLLDLTAPEETQNVGLLHAQEIRDTLTFETTHITKDGRRFCVEMTSKPVALQGEEVFLSIARPLPPHQRREQIVMGSEAYFQLAFRASPGAVSISRLSDGVLIDINDGFCRLTGYSREEVLGKPSTRLNIWKNPAERRRFTAQLKSQGTVENMEVVFLSQDGRSIPTLLSSRIFTLNGEPHLLNIAKDITDLAEARDRLAESEERFRKVFNASPDAILITRLEDRRFVDVNPAFTQLTGYTREEAVGKTAAELNLWVNRETWERGNEITLRNDGTFPPSEAVFRHKDGTHLIGLISAAAVDLQGEPHILSIVRNIGWVKQTQEKIRRSEYMLKEAQRIAHIGSWKLDLQEDDLEWSDETYRIFEISPEETKVTYEVFLSVVHPDDRGMVERVYAQSLKTQEPYAIEHRLLMPDGRVKWVREQGETTYDPEGNPLHTIGTVLDITLQKNTEQALIASEARFRYLFENSPVALFEMDIGDLLPYLQSLPLTSEGGEVFEGNLSAEILRDSINRVRLLSANQAGLNLAEAEDERELLGPLSKLPSQVVFYAIKEGLPHVTVGHQIVEGEISIATLRGTPKDVYFRFMWQEGEQDAHHPSVVAVIDITPLKRALQAEQKARALAETIQQANLALAASLDLHAVTETLLSHLENLIPYDSASIMLRQNETEFVILHTRKYEAWLDAEDLAGLVLDMRTKPHLQRIIEEGKSVVLADTRQAPGWVRIPGTEHVISWLGVPLITGGEVIGIYSIDKAEANFFTEEHMRLAESLGAQAATAIKNALLYKEARQRAQDFATLYDGSQALAGKASLEAVLNDIAQYTYRLLGSTGISIYRYDPSDQHLTTVLSTHPSVPPGTRLKPGEGMAGKIAQTRRPLRVDDYATWEGRSPQYDSSLFGAVLEVPMLYHEELVGVLAVYENRDNPRKFTQEDERLLSLFATQAAASIHSTRLLEETRRRLARIQTLRRIDRVIAGSIDINVTLNTVLDEVINQPGVDAACILLLEPNTLRLECAALRGFRRDTLKDIFLRVGEGWPGRVVLERRVLHIAEISQHLGKDRRADLLISEGFSAYHALPLIAKGTVKGVLEIFLRAPSERDDEWNEFLLALGGQIAIALDNSALFRNLQRANLELSLAYDATIEGWSHALDLRDKETEGHTLRVTKMVLELARAAGLEGEVLVHIRRGALLHDIGKMGVPDAILHKPAPLSAEERALMEKHPQFAYDMLSPIEYLRPALDIPYCHHEKWDGSGYPRGLEGEEIPLAARLFAVVDVYDALTSNRPYRKAWPKEKAVQYIREQTGKHFDPRAVSLFLRLFA